MHHNFIVVAAVTASLGSIAARPLRRHRAAHRDFGKNFSGLYNMPGHMMTRRGKINQMQHDFETCNRRKGKPR
jgi:hypothetical protein